jgi:spore coat protein U-like protein
MRTRLVIFLASLLLPSPLWAQTCSFSISSEAFGTVDTLSGANTDVSATLAISCSGGSLSTVRICPSIGAGSGGATASARQMPSSSATLKYQLYSDSGRSVVWGSYNWGLAATPPTIDLPLGLGGSASTNVSINGRVFGGQGSATPGSYASNFSATDVDIAYGTLALQPCPNPVASPQHQHPTFSATGTVSGNCLVSAVNIDFGTHGNIGANVDTTGLLSVSCTPGTTYNVGLGDGNANAGPTGRKMSLSSATIAYGLYSDSARTRVWGSTIGTNTTAATGNGAVQPYTVYARVPPQPLPSAGVYIDTIIVTITY